MPEDCIQAERIAANVLRAASGKYRVVEPKGDPAIHQRESLLVRGLFGCPRSYKLKPDIFILQIQYDRKIGIQ
jgi:hypothetical protein